MGANVPIVPNPTMVWSKTYSSGQWLHCFTALLVKLLPKGYFTNNDKRKAVREMCVAADYFIVSLSNADDFDREEWSAQISDAAQAGLGAPTVDEFHQYVANGRKSVMSFEDVERCLDKNKLYLFASMSGDMEDAKEGVKAFTEGYLTRLRNLRLAVKKVISFLDLDQPYRVQGYLSDRVYQINLRKLYEEFKSHYAYETALCIPMY